MPLFLAAVPFVASATVGVVSAFKKKEEKKKTSSKPKPKPISTPLPKTKPITTIRPSTGNKGPTTIVKPSDKIKPIVIEEDTHKDPDGMPLSAAVTTVSKPVSSSLGIKPSPVSVAKLSEDPDEAPFMSRLESNMKDLFALKPCVTDDDLGAEVVCMDANGAAFVGMASGILTGITLATVFKTSALQGALLGLVPGAVLGKIVLSDQGIPSTMFK